MYSNLLELKQHYFIPQSYVDKKKIKISEEGLYSVSNYIDNFKILNYLKKIKYNYKNSIFIDLTANNGGTSIFFAHFFKEVISIELDKVNYEYLLHNIKLYKLKNIITYLNDSTIILPEIINKKKFTKKVLFIDPPWGGTNYKENKKINLYLSNINISDIVKNNINFFDLIILSLPNNYNFNELNKKIKNKKNILKLKKYIILIIFS